MLPFCCSAGQISISGSLLCSGVTGQPYKVGALRCVLWRYPSLITEEPCASIPSQEFQAQSTLSTQVWAHSRVYELEPAGRGYVPVELVYQVFKCSYFCMKGTFTFLSIILNLQNGRGFEHHGEEEELIVSYYWLLVFFLLVPKLETYISRRADKLVNFIVPDEFKLLGSGPAFLVLLCRHTVYTWGSLWVVTVEVTENWFSFYDSSPE